MIKLLLSAFIATLLATGPGLSSPKSKFKRGHGGQVDLGEPVDPPPEDPSVNAGAHLPITGFTVASLGGTARYVAVGGAGTSGGGCTLALPCPSINTAHTAASTNDPIILRAGTYTGVGNTWNGTAWTGDLTVTKAGIKIYAYPDETVVFDGSINAFASTWTTEGSYKYTAYIDRICQEGFGVPMCTDGPYDNVNGDGVGRLPDQVWIDGLQIKQVMTKAAVVSSGTLGPTFYVDPTNNRLYLHATTKDGAASEIAICDRGDFMNFSGADQVIRGFTIKRYCNSPVKAAVLDLAVTADRFIMRDIVIEDIATTALFMQGSSTNMLEDPLIQNITIQGTNWVGINLVYNIRPIFDGIKLINGDRWDEFDTSPQSGALKTSRVWYSEIKNSYVSNNKSQGIWYDQSNYDALIFNNSIINNGVAGEGTCFFWEISDGLKLFNNYIKCPISTNVKIAGSSGAQILNNTLVGGKDVLGIYTDARSVAGCNTNTDGDDGLIDNVTHADDTSISCGAFNDSSQWRGVGYPLPNTVDWMPRIDTIQGNVIVYPSSAGLCASTKTAVCIARINGPANRTLASVIHVAEPGRSIPQTKMDCNVYATSSGNIMMHTSPTSSAYISYTAANFPSAFTANMASPSLYPDIDGLEANSLVGTQYVDAEGSPTQMLTDLHATSPCVFPTDTDMNPIIAAGSQHYGVMWK